MEPAPGLGGGQPSRPRLYAPLFDAPDPDRPVNIARFKFLDPAARVFFADWDVPIHNMAALLRMGTGQAPDDEQLSELIMELQDGSPEFKQMWAQHEVTLHRNGTKHFHHPVVGDLDLPFETLILPAHPDLPAHGAHTGAGNDSGGSDAPPGRLVRRARSRPRRASGRCGPALRTRARPSRAGLLRVRA
ncbi:hypothetical protein ACFUNF_33980 [Streptomyces sp. NPDC057291]|uniref:MmyB family transcriptional regulator n=1 Tax=Streptomyces sp. NPDC057291 TaxID=3346087 RepID=UPI003642232A